MFTILGSGFGLYGYLPALVDGCGEQVTLPERYRSRLQARPELVQLESRVRWSPDENAALDESDGIVIALPPERQAQWLPECIARANLRRLILEKPLASSPEIAQELAAELVRKRKSFRLGYTFRFTDWGQWWLANGAVIRRSGQEIWLAWNFLAHHFRNDLQNWKRHHSTGGGALRFYGIQVIALLADMGYCDVTASQAFAVAGDEIERWTARFSGGGQPDCTVTLDSRSEENRFVIRQGPASSGPVAGAIADLSDPFETRGDPAPLSHIDRRIPLLVRVARSLEEDDSRWHQYYDAATKLWSLTESRTTFNPMDAQERRARST